MVKDIKDWNLKDFLNELNRRLTIEKGKIMDTDEYIKSSDVERQHLLYEVEDKVYGDVSEILINNTEFVEEREENGVSFGKCRVEPHTHEMSHPYLVCDGRYFVLTKFYEYDNFLHTRLSEIEENNTRKLMDGISVGDILKRHYGSYYEVLKKNKKTILIRMLKEDENGVVKKGNYSISWDNSFYEHKEKVRSRDFNFEIIKSDIIEKKVS